MVLTLPKQARLYKNFEMTILINEPENPSALWMVLPLCAQCHEKGTQRAVCV